MKDTLPEVGGEFTELFATRPGSDRVRMTCDVFDDAKALVAAGIRARYPDISAASLRVRMFDQLYFGDFDEASRTRIISALAD